MKEIKNLITPDIRKDMPPRGKGKKSLMLEAIRAHCGTEGEFLLEVIKAAIGDPLKDIAPNPVLMNMVLQRIEPPMKSTMPLVEFEFTPTSKPHEQAAQVMKAAADGLIPPDIANMFVSSIASMMKIEEVTEIARRLESIEASLGLSNG
jgi:hypothetical protein